MIGACERGPRVTGAEQFNYPRIQDLEILQGVREIQSVWRGEMKNKSYRNFKIFELIFEESKAFTRQGKPQAMITSRAFLKASFFLVILDKRKPLNVRYGRVTNTLRFFQKERFDMARVLKSYEKLRRSKILTYLTLLKYPNRKILFSLQ